MFSQASPAKFYVSIVFNFSWDGSNTPEKRKTKVIQRLAGGGGGTIKVHYGRCTRVTWPSEVATAKFLTKIEWKKTLFDGQSIYNLKTPVYILEPCQEIG